MKKIILLDVDEVICDFIGGACFEHRFTRKELEARRIPGKWSIQKPLGLMNSEFWHPIRQKGEKFWENLRPLPWAAELLKMINETGLDYYLVTGPDDHHTSYSGKILWAKRWLGAELSKKIIPTQHKWLLSGPNRLLIDDKEKNLIKFEFDDDGNPRGGFGLLFPSRGNSLHAMADNPLEYIRIQLNEFQLQKRKRRISPLNEVFRSDK